MNEQLTVRFNACNRQIECLFRQCIPYLITQLLADFYQKLLRVKKYYEEPEKIVWP